MIKAFKIVTTYFNDLNYDEKRSTVYFAHLTTFSILGYFFYDDVPDLFTVIGALIITSSGIFVINQTSSK